MFIWLFRNKIEKFFQLFSNPHRVFFIWIRLISILTFIFQIQTLISISNYALILYKQRKILINQLHDSRVLFISTIRRYENRSKYQKTLKRLERISTKNFHHRIRTI